MTDHDDLTQVGKEIGEALFGASRSESPEAEPEQAGLAELDEDRQEAARRHGLPVALAKRIKGETWAEINADARKLKELMPEPPVRGPVEDARRDLAVAEQATGHPNQAELIALQRKRVKSAEQAAALGFTGKKPS